MDALACPLGTVTGLIGAGSGSQFLIRGWIVIWGLVSSLSQGEECTNIPDGEWYRHEPTLQPVRWLHGATASQWVSFVGPCGTAEQHNVAACCSALSTCSASSAQLSLRPSSHCVAAQVIQAMAEATKNPHMLSLRSEVNRVGHPKFTLGPTIKNAGQNLFERLRNANCEQWKPCCRISRPQDFV